MNRKTSVLMVLLVVAVVGGALALGLSGNHSAANGCKPGKPASHIITIRDGKASTTDVQARFCDTLTITNKDDIAREIAFGVHAKHTAYDGVMERVLAKDGSLKVTLNKVGTYHWHDHLHDEVQGYFTVTQ